ncbi:hypothetical protein TNCV_205921 [Trichonephila clavipes]|nr:hypothetical protein TNCV_205921 [Trichonephila clavipes]
MGKINQHRTWSRKPRLVGGNCDNSNHWEDVQRDAGSGQANEGISSECRLKSLAYETSLATVEDITALIVVASADVISTPDLFERVGQSFVRLCRLCYDLRSLNFKQLL